jgi:hypothetical protein
MAAERRSDSLPISCASTAADTNSTSIHPCFLWML